MRNLKNHMTNTSTDPNYAILLELICCGKQENIKQDMDFDQEFLKKRVLVDKQLKKEFDRSKLQSQYTFSLNEFKRTSQSEI